MRLLNETEWDKMLVRRASHRIREMPTDEMKNLLGEIMDKGMSYNDRYTIEVALRITKTLLRDPLSFALKVFHRISK